MTDQARPLPGHRARWNTRPRPVRRQFAAATLSLTAFAAGLAGCGSDEAPAAAADTGSIVIAGTPLSTTDILMSMALDKKLPADHDVDLGYERVRTVSVLYQDFTAGRYDCILTDPGVFAQQASEGLPVTVLAAVSPIFAYLIAGKNSGIKDPGDLVGKRMVAATATGGYKVFSAIAAKWYDVDFESDVEVVQAASDVDGLAQISTGSADAMFTFETSVTNSVMSDSSVAVVYKPGDDYTERTGERLWENVLMCRTDHQLDSAAVDRAVDVISEVSKMITDDPAAADAFAVDQMDAEKGVYKESFSSGRLSFDVSALNDKNKQEMINMIKFQQEAGTMEQFDIPDSYFDGL